MQLPNFSSCLILLVAFGINIDLIRSGESNNKSKGNTTWSHKLRQDLTLYYDNLFAPASQSNFISVNITLKIVNVNLDYKLSQFTIAGCIITEWYDARLKWNSSNYDGLNQIQISSYEIWKPNVVAYNSMTTEMSRSSYDSTSCTVNSTGHVSAMPPTSYQVFCDVDLSHWPFDTQTCKLVLSSTTYDGSIINLNVKNVQNGGVLVENKPFGWDISEMTYQQKKEYGSLFSEPYMTIEYLFKIKKAQHVYHSFIVLPAFAVACLLLSSFLILPDEMEKFLLNTLVCIIASLFLLFFSIKVPVLLYQTPNIVKFYGYTLCLSLVYLIINVVLYNMSTKSLCDKKKLPISLTSFINKHSYTLFLFQPRKFHYMNFVGQEWSKVPVNIDSLNGNLVDPNLKEELIETKDSDAHVQWYQLAVAVDRLIFLLYVTIITFMLIFLVICL